MQTNSCWVAALNKCIKMILKLFEIIQWTTCWWATWAWGTIFFIFSILEITWLCHIFLFRKLHLKKIHLQQQHAKKIHLTTNQNYFHYNSIIFQKPSVVKINLEAHEEPTCENTHKPTPEIVNRHKTNDASICSSVIKLKYDNETRQQNLTSEKTVNIFAVFVL